MNTQRAAMLQALLEGIPLPARKEDVLAYLRRQGDADGLVGEVESIPDREYRALDEVAEELAPVQPRPHAEERLPRPESDEPPGGADYVEPNPEPGAVRHDAPPDNPPQKALEEQTKAQKRQQKTQEEG